MQGTPSAESVLQLADAAAAGLSALNEELSDKRCSRWPKRLYLLASDGLWVPGRCGSSNLCEYCLIQELHVIRRMLSQQAADGPAPELVAVLGTGLATWDPAPFYGGRELVMRKLKREFGPQVSYACLSEFTTGKSSYSGGLRRPHWNMLLGGIAAEYHDQARELVIPTWCDNAPDTDPAAQYVEPLRDTAALMRYLANHFTKTDQLPPQDGRWKHKQRFNCSRNYFGELTRAEARERAWKALRLDREVHKAYAAGHDDPVAAGQLAAEYADRLAWSLERKGAIEPQARAHQLGREIVLKAKRWEYQDNLKRDRQSRPGPRARATLSPALRAPLSRSAEDQQGPEVAGRVSAGREALARPQVEPSRPPAALVLHFRKEVKHGGRDS